MSTENNTFDIRTYICCALQNQFIIDTVITFSFIRHGDKSYVFAFT